MPAIIRFDQATVAVRDKTILSNFSFTLHTGEKAVLCGKSGSGKSTVLKTLLGLQTLTSGKVYFQEKPLDYSTIQAIRSHTAYIGQEPVLGADTVRDALLLPFQYKAHRDHKPTDTQIMSILEQLHLPADILNQESSRISGGEKQRLALARGLLLGKNLYLLDEVTSALDPESKQAVFEVFANPELTVLSVAHDPDWITRCDIALELEEGHLTQETRHEHA
ncbi:MAG: ATP-binding cassette domain-containing protein [Methylovulum sp.]|uniref:ABC transporter ATP-binding protein n=1 Tax=Methylovulum sp. TaxID=1916980 RepID=UPI002608B845|nr:ATP-binding cassette domain-containing protein [Methylovulum sp.]MDD2725289.1 ATP-binding cassette domain-containing protein [Methylovulum sp.]MDD5125134.1 ATP-binding cassette domain-containing protein [Methylovulum sp.]